MSMILQFAIAALFLGSNYTPPAKSGGGITALTGDVTASGTGSVAATLATIQSAAHTFSGVLTLSANNILGANAASNTTLASGISLTCGSLLSGGTSNQAGSSCTFSAGSGKGSGTPSTIVFQAPPLGSTGTALTTPTTLLTIGGNSGTYSFGNNAWALQIGGDLFSSITSQNWVLQNNNATAFRFWNSAAALFTFASDGSGFTASTSGGPINALGGFVTQRSTVVASTTQTLAAATVCTDICNVGTVANAADAVKLSLAASSGGRIIHVFNQGAQAMSLFPDASGSKICTPATIFGAASCGSAGASVSVAAGELLDCVQYDNTANWGCK
jgi:hypothetical protein